MSTQSLSLQQVAERLGVHYMTVYRYVRHGHLAASKSGGTWEVAIEALERFQAGEPPGRGMVDWPERLVSRMMVGDTLGALGVVDAALAAGATPRSIYLDVLTPALHEVGERWASGEIGVDEEHIASAVAMRVMGRLGPRFARRGRTRGTVLCASPPLDRHAVSTAMLADLLRAEGYDAVDLGADLPIESLRAATARHDPMAVAISVSVPVPMHALEQAAQAVRDVAPRAIVVIGGRAAPTAVPKGAHARIASVDELIAVLGDGSAFDAADR